MGNPTPEPANAGFDTGFAKAPYRIGTVTLIARDASALARFYQDVLGLAPVSRDAGTVRFGVGDTVLVTLRRDPAARPWTSREAGLFHTAFLLPGRGDLGAWLLHAGELGITLTGAADHLVSEAVYLDDPEGNGIEIYVDRPAEAWTWASNGTVVMRNDRLDRAGIVDAAAGPWDRMPAGSRVGHVHLQVGGLDVAEGFHTGLLGFDVMCRYPGALFLGAGGHHHQLACNVWNSRGAPVRDGATNRPRRGRAARRGADPDGCADVLAGRRPAPGRGRGRAPRGGPVGNALAPHPHARDDGPGSALLSAPGARLPTARAGQYSVGGPEATAEMRHV
ncbi:VOC family protein [Methylobacterium radiodurans]|uniref:VOC family protein n=1 Tax=Methylobacterium radiodurans TaxID=2202828 RepID=UPI001FE5451D|nr:VOC family protein [Methylobacterium radiodurans]